MTEIYLVTAEPWLPAANALGRLDSATTPGLTTAPSDTPPDHVFAPTLISPGNIERHLFQSGTTRGRSDVGFGAVVLNNADGALDPVVDWGFDGRAIALRRGTLGAAYPAGFPLVWVGTLDQAEVDWRRVSLRVRDRQAHVIEKPLQAALYGGTNQLPNGVDGTPEDLQGRPKPLIFGRVRNAHVPVVNTAKLVYQLSSDAVSAIDAVYDRGATLTRGANRSTVANLMATNPASGTFDWVLADSAGAFIRLGSVPAGQITVDAVAGATPAERTVAAIQRRILERVGSLQAGDFDAASFTALSSAASAEVGLFTGVEPVVTGDALDLLAGSIGAWWTVTRLGAFRVGRLQDPATTSPTGRIEAWQVLASDSGIARIATADPGGGIPVWRIQVRYDRNWSPTNEAGLAGIALSRIAWLREEYRTVVNDSAAILTAHPRGVELTVDTVLTTKADAEAEASRLRTLYGQRRDWFAVPLAMDHARGFDLGDVVELAVPRYGLDAGKRCIILGLIEDFERGQTTLHLWG
jgi:hypothetical protein